MVPTMEHADEAKSVRPRPAAEVPGFDDLVVSLDPGERRSEQVSDRLDSVIVLVLTVLIAMVALTGLGDGSSHLEKAPPALQAREAEAVPASS